MEMSHSCLYCLGKDNAQVKHYHFVERERERSGRMTSQFCKMGTSFESHIPGNGIKLQELAIIITTTTTIVLGIFPAGEKMVDWMSTI